MPDLFTDDEKKRLEKYPQFGHLLGKEPATPTARTAEPSSKFSPDELQRLTKYPQFAHLRGERATAIPTPSYGEPTLPEAAWTGLRGGLAGAVGMYEKALELPLRPLGIPETPLKRVQEWLSPSEEESRRLETAGIPAKIAAGFGGIPGAVAKYGPATALMGPVGGFAVPEAIEAAERGPWEMAKGGAKGAAFGLGFKYLQALGMLPRMGGMAGMFGGEALLETGKPREAIAPAVVGAGIGLMGGRRRATAPPEARPEPEPITEPTKLLPYRPRELEWWRGPGAKGVEGISIPEGPLALPPGQGFLMREPTQRPTRPILRPAPLRGMPYDIDPITGEPISALPPVPGRPRGPSPVGTPGLWMPEEQIPAERVAPPPVEGPPRPPAEPSPPAPGVEEKLIPKTFRQFVESRGTKWPLKSTDPQAESLKTEWDNLSKTGHVGEVFAGELKKGDRLLKEGELYTVTEKTKDRMTIKDGETYQLDPKTGRIQGRKLEKGEEPFVGPGAASVYEKLKENVGKINTAFVPREAGRTFVEEDIVPKAVQFGKGLKDTFEWLKKGLVPLAGVPKEALETTHRYLGGLMKAREYFALRDVIESKTVNEIVDQFAKMTPVEKDTWINNTMTGTKQATSYLDQVSDYWHGNFTELWHEINKRTAEGGPSIGWKDNYFRLWLKNPSEENIKSFTTALTKKLPGTKGWTKERFFDTWAAAKEAGFELSVDNPIEMAKMSYMDELQFIQFFDMKKDLQKLGFVKKLTEENLKKGKSQGFAKTTENLNNIWFQGKGEGWYVEENLGRILNNYLSRDWIRANVLGRTMMTIKNATTIAELGLSGFHGSVTGFNSIMSALGEASMKIYNKGILEGNIKDLEVGLKEMAKAPISPYIEARLGGKAWKFFANKEEFLKTVDGQSFINEIPNADYMLDLLYQVGGRLGMAEDYKLNTLRAFHESIAQKNYIGAAFRSIPGLLQIVQKPLFEQFIPKLKVGKWLKETIDAFRAQADDITNGKTSHWEIAYDKWRFVEQRFGEMSFDNQFWNRTFKTAMQMFIRSVTWQTGNIQAFGKGITRQSRELISAMREGRMPRLTPEGAWMMATFAGTAALGYTVQKALSGKEPEKWQDYFYPQIDDEGNRISLPTYARVGFSMAHDPIHYISAIMSGWFGRFIDIIHNKDFYGTQIHDPEDNIIEKAVDDLVHLVPLPFSVTTMKQLRQERVPFPEQFMGFAGGTKAPYWIRASGAEQLASELSAAKFPVGGMAKERRKKLDLIRDYTRQWKQAEQKGEPTDNILANIQSDISGGRLTRQDLMNFRQRITREPIEQSILRLSLKEALRVWDKATDDEKAKIRPYILRKFTRSHPEEREVALPKMQQIQTEMWR